MGAANAGHPEPGAAAARPVRQRDPTVVWAYAIADGGAGDLAGDLAALAGVGRAPVRVATCSGLSMLVSDVSQDEFGEAALLRNLENLDWLDAVARAHHDVIDAAARLFPLLPTRLATVYSGDEAVCATLAGRRTALRDALRRVGGYVEWGVKAYARPESQTATGGQADLAAGGDDGRAGAGRAYLQRRRAQLTAGRESRAAAVEAARSVHDALAGQAKQARFHPPQSAQLTEVPLPMMLNAAYLVAADDAADFGAAVAAQAAARPELRIELTGPWPPYSFADADERDDDDDGR